MNTEYCTMIPEEVFALPKLFPSDGSECYRQLHEMERARKRHNESELLLKIAQLREKVNEYERREQTEVYYTSDHVAQLIHAIEERDDVLNEREIALQRAADEMAELREKLDQAKAEVEMLKKGNKYATADRDAVGKANCQIKEIDIYNELMSVQDKLSTKKEVVNDDGGLSYLEQMMDQMENELYEQREKLACVENAMTEQNNRRQRKWECVAADTHNMENILKSIRIKSVQDSINDKNDCSLTQQHQKSEHALTPARNDETNTINYECQLAETVQIIEDCMAKQANSRKLSQGRVEIVINPVPLCTLAFDSNEPSWTMSSLFRIVQSAISFVKSAFREDGKEVEDLEAQW